MAPFDIFVVGCVFFSGVAGFVLNENGELLVIRERFSVIKSKPWKLPGGLADKGQSSVDKDLLHIKAYCLSIQSTYLIYLPLIN